MISVIVPAYNCIHTIGKCLDSILNQTYNNIEVIVINDGSSDGTLQILEGYGHRIRLYSQDNSGVSAARNRGIDLAEGEYLLFVDSDDYLTLNTLQALIDVEMLHGTDLIGSAIVTEGGYSANNAALGEYAEFYSVEPEEIGHYMYYLGMAFVWGKLYKTCIIRDYSIRFREDITRAEDSIFVHTYVQHCASIEKVSNAKYIVQNVNAQSLSKRFTENIEISIEAERESIRKCYALYPEYERVTNCHTVPIEVSKCFVYAQNLYLHGCPYSNRQKRQFLKHYLIEEGNIDAFDDIKWNSTRYIAYRLQCLVFKTKSVHAISCFYEMKEIIKKIIVTVRK